MVHFFVRAVAGLALCAGCVGTESPPVEIPSVEGLPAALPGGDAAQNLLIRASLDLQGRRPAPEALANAARGGAALERELDALMQGERFGLRVRDWFAPSYQTRWGSFIFEEGEDEDENEDEDAPDQENEAGEQRAMSLALEWEEAPLRFYEDAALRDLPITSVLTADYGFVGPTTAQVEPVTGYDPARGGIQRVQYTDGRPAAGVLANIAVWMRHVSSETNLNRVRANAVSRILLCDDYLVRPVDFPRDIDLTDERGIENAIRENPGCQACHASLDPLAAYFGSFDYEPGVEGREGLRYRGHPDQIEYEDEEVEPGAEPAGGGPPTAPGYFGSPGRHIGDLARQIAGDPRFLRCTTTRVYEGLIGRPAGPADADAITYHEAVFRAGGLRLRNLVASIVRDPVYAGGELGDRAGLPAKLVSPEVLELSVEAVTGFRPVFDGLRPVMRNDREGLHVLGGGVDSLSGAHPPALPNATQVMVQRWLAEAAAAQAIASDADRERIFGDADLDSGWSTAAARSMLLHLLGQASDDNLDAAEALYADLTTLGASPLDAWRGVLSAFLRIPEFVTY